MTEPTNVPIGSVEYSRVLAWLYNEAALLDRGRYDDWLGLISPEITYRMPVRQAVLAKEGAGFDDESGFFLENHASLATRVRRLGTDQAWSDQPVSRTRHFVSNVLIEESNNRYEVRCAFLVTRIRSDMPYDLFTGERVDQLEENGDRLLLAKRTIYLDQTILKSHNLSIFF